MCAPASTRTPAGRGIERANRLVNRRRDVASVPHAADLFRWDPGRNENEGLGWPLVSPSQCERLIARQREQSLPSPALGEGPRVRVVRSGTGRARWPDGHRDAHGRDPGRGDAAEVQATVRMRLGQKVAERGSRTRRVRMNAAKNKRVGENCRKEV